MDRKEEMLHYMRLRVANITSCQEYTFTALPIKVRELNKPGYYFRPAQ